MGKATILEAQNSNTVYEEGKAKGTLGKLKGIFADFKNGTRNSDRLYTESLWDNRVFGSEDVMEALNTKTLFGELDHPEGDRCETLAQNAAITITKLEKNPEEGVIYGEAEILDTPTGRIVKALADSGAQLGISSRGMGEEIFEEGKNIIDPDTYDFITFDVVVTPANTKARVALAESKKRDKLIESLKKEIKESETANQLNQIKKVLEGINHKNKEELVTIVENKLLSFTKKEENKTKLDEVNRQIALDLIKRKMESKTIELKESNRAAEDLAAENTKLIEKVEFLEESRKLLQEKITESVNAINETKVECENHNKVLENLKIIHNRKIERLEKIHAEDINKLQETIKKESDEKQKTLALNVKLMESNQKLSKNITESSKILLENKELKLQIEKLEKEKLEEARKYENELANHKSKLEENKKIESAEIEKLKKQLEESKIIIENQKLEEDNFRKLSFSPVGTVKALKENFSNKEEWSVEDQQLFNVLTNK